MDNNFTASKSNANYGTAPHPKFMHPPTFNYYFPVKSPPAQVSVHEGQDFNLTCNGAQLGYLFEGCTQKWFKDERAVKTYEDITPQEVTYWRSCIQPFFGASNLLFMTHSVYRSERAFNFALICICLLISLIFHIWITLLFACLLACLLACEPSPSNIKCISLKQNIKVWAMG